jgi:hypothetical protein
MTLDYLAIDAVIYHFEFLCYLTSDGVLAHRSGVSVYIHSVGERAFTVNSP